MTDPREWWDSLDADRREELDAFARRSILDGLAGYPYWDQALCVELLAWSHLENEVLEAHAKWLAAARAKFERNGWPWTTGELARRWRLWEVE